MLDHIEIYNNSLSGDFCEQLITKFESSGNRLTPGRSSGGIDKSRKDSVDLAISSYPDWQPITQQISQVVHRYLVAYARKYSHLLFGAVGTKLRNARTGDVTVVTHKLIEELPDEGLMDLVCKMYKLAPINLQRYTEGVGGYHKWHSEISPSDPNCEVLHRTLFYIFYLNDIADGGETSFYYQERKVEARRGRLVISPAGFTHTHKGEVPHSDDKYILASWIKFKRFEEIFQQ